MGIGLLTLGGIALLRADRLIDSGGDRLIRGGSIIDSFRVCIHCILTKIVADHILNITNEGSTVMVEKAQAIHYCLERELDSNADTFGYFFFHEWYLDHRFCKKSCILNELSKVYCFLLSAWPYKKHF